MRSPIRAAALILLSSIVAAPSNLPDFARGFGKVVDPRQVDMSDVISYRRITREDFKATRLMEQKREHGEKIGAMTCAHLMSDSGSEVIATPVRGTGAAAEYEISVRNLGFRALMNRRCSWWTSRPLPFPEAYLLEHEQIHFALYELEARELNARAGAIAAAMRVRARSKSEGMSAIQRKVEEALGGGVRELLARSDRFDADTSLVYEPEKQKEWLRVVESELAATARYASAPFTPPSKRLTLPRAPE